LRDIVTYEYFDLKCDFHSDKIGSIKVALKTGTPDELMRKV
jgi:hypothetical protein